MIELHSDDVNEASGQLAGLSAWIDEANAARDPEALGWHRVAKTAEEAGEAISEWLLFTGGNPRKPASADDSKVIEELLDTAVAALGAVEHLRGNTGVAISYLFDKIGRVHGRAMSAEAGTVQA